MGDIVDVELYLLRHSLCDVAIVFTRSIAATQLMSARRRNGWMMEKKDTGIRTNEIPSI